LDSASVFPYLAQLDRLVSENELTRREFFVDGHRWLIFRRSNYAQVFRNATWDGTGTSALSSTAKSLVVVPKSLAGIELERPNTSPTATEATSPEGNGLRIAGAKERTILESRLAPRRDFAVAVRPLSTWPYQPDQGLSDPIVLAKQVPAQQQRLLVELNQTVEWATKNLVGILVLPELMLSIDSAQHLQELIQRCGSTTLALVVVGLGHRESKAPNTWLNEALVLGPRGGVLWAHQKFDPYNHQGAAENLESGTVLTVMETPIGNLTVGICKDLIGAYQARYIDSGAEWLLNPSMSKETSAHRSAAQTLMARSLISTVCANRPFGEAITSADTWGSFVRLPGSSSRPSQGEIEHRNAAAGHPGLIVRMDYSS
jgi:Carbon-nitrogen hydrolase